MKTKRNIIRTQKANDEEHLDTRKEDDDINI